MIEAYLAGPRGLRRRPVDDRVSVASFFVSRVDTEIDGGSTQIGTDAALAAARQGGGGQREARLRAVPRAVLGHRWEALAARGARVQRPLWASTSTKNPAYPDTLYVDSSSGRDTVNTMPEATLEAFEDHGTLARTVDADLDGARTGARRAGRGRRRPRRRHPTLEDEGVASFSKSFDELIDRARPRPTTSELRHG